MKPIVFNFNDSFQSRTSEAIALKAGYLLGDEVYSAGSTFIDVFYTEHLQRMSLDQKLSFLKARIQDDEKLEAIEQSIEMSKMAKKIKHKTPEQIAFGKKFEKLIDRCLEQEMREMEIDMSASGFTVIRDLMEEEIIKHYLINVSAESVIPGFAITASHLLQRLLPNIKEDEEPEIFFLGTEFFRDEYSEPCVYMEADETAFDKQNISLCKCFTLPDITSLTAAELKNLRQQLQQSGTLFREKINEWIDMCYFGEAIPDRIGFFTNELLPAASVLQKCIDKNETCKLHGTSDDDTEKIEVWIGEMPVHELWNYYRDYDVIKDCTWSKMEKLKETGGYDNQRWPVLVLNVPESILSVPAEEDEIQVEEIKASKKYLLVD